MLHSISVLIHNFFGRRKNPAIHATCEVIEAAIEATYGFKDSGWTNPDISDIRLKNYQYHYRPKIIANKQLGFAVAFDAVILSNDAIIQRAVVFKQSEADKEVYIIAFDLEETAWAQRLYAVQQAAFEKNSKKQKKLDDESKVFDIHENCKQIIKSVDRGLFELKQKKQQQIGHTKCKI